MIQFIVLILLCLCAGCTVESESSNMGMYLRDTESLGNPDAPKTAWSVSGTLQRENRSRSVSLQVILEIPETYSIQFNASRVVKLDPDAAPTITTAVIEWSVEGNTITRKVSVGDGVTISGCASAVRVVVKDETEFNGNAHDTSEYTVSVNVTRGVRAMQPNPPFLRDATPITLDADGGTVVLDIPDNIGVSSVYVGVLASAAANSYDPTKFRVIQLDEAGLFVIGTQGPTDWIPIVPGATKLGLINYNTNAVAVGVLWGIDG